jgi:5-methylcytosine-specific restriction endonuclease McrA
MRVPVVKPRLDNAGSPPNKVKPKARKTGKACPRCGKSIATDKTVVRKYCSPTCRKATARKTRQARLRLGYVEHVSMTVLRERDHDTCRICGKPVDFSKQQPDPSAATIDHVVALTRGGEHSYGNTQLAHFRCNTVKGAG